jgi:hypothetical protein
MEMLSRFAFNVVPVPPPGPGLIMSHEEEEIGITMPVDDGQRSPSTKGVGEVDIEDEKSNYMTNGRAKNGSSVHLLDAPVIVNTAALEGTGTTLNAKRDNISISLVQPSASANADISKHTKMNNSPSHQRSFQRANVAVSILLHSLSYLTFP